jgi:hypothetical protein
MHRLPSALCLFALVSLASPFASARQEFDPKNHLQFDIVGDGRFRTDKVKLSSAETYQGAMSYLFVRPTLKPEEGGWVKIKRIRLGK